MEDRHVGIPGPDDRGLPQLLVHIWAARAHGVQQRPIVRRAPGGLAGGAVHDDARQWAYARQRRHRRRERLARPRQGPQSQGRQGPHRLVVQRRQHPGETEGAVELRRGHSLVYQDVGGV